MLLLVCYANSPNRKSYKILLVCAKCEFDILCFISLLYFLHIFLYIVTYMINNYMFIIVFAYKLIFYFIILRLIYITIIPKFGLK